MSLHNVDKTNDNRKDPQLNQNDHVDKRMAHGTTQIHNKTEADTSTGSLSFLERQILAQESGVNKAVFGFLDESDTFGLKVAKEGYNVLTATDDQLIFNSTQNVFKIVQKGTASLTIPAVTGATTFQTTINHNLGYTPIPLVFEGTGPSYLALPVSHGLTTSGLFVAANAIFYYDVSSSTLNINANTGQNAGNPSYSGTFQFTYYLLQETVTPG